MGLAASVAACQAPGPGVFWPRMAGERPRSAESVAMDRYARGEAAAFAELYQALSPRLFRYLMRMSRDRAKAEDLLQQTFLRMHHARASFTEGSDVVPWSYAIARRLFIDSTRRHRREVLASGDEAPGEEAASELPDGEQLARARQLSTAIAKELERLPSAHREAYQLVREEGLSMAEAAAVLGTTVAAVKLRAHRAYDGLRVALQAAGLGPEGGGE